MWRAAVCAERSVALGLRARNAGDLTSMPGLGSSHGEENATHSSILAWKISWTEEPGRL